MKPFTTLHSKAIALRKANRLMENIDTDMIIPKQFLKTTEREGLSNGLFYELKTKPDGRSDPDFILNRPEARNANICLLYTSDAADD